MSVTGIPTNAMFLIFTGNHLVLEPIDKYSCYFWIERRALSFECVGEIQIVLKGVAHLRDFILKCQLPVGGDVGCDQPVVLRTQYPDVGAPQRLACNFR